MAPTTLLVLLSARMAAAITAQVFTPPSTGPLVQTSNYTSFSNNTLNDKITKGKAFDRIIHIWLENTDFEVNAAHLHNRMLLLNLQY
jgi:hypothetical protein